MLWTAPRTALNGSDLFVDREQLATFNAVARRLVQGYFRFVALAPCRSPTWQRTELRQRSFSV
jgi:hypothetical protein